MRTGTGREKIYITGLGAVGPHGAGMERFWAAALKGESLLAPLERLGGAFVGEATGFSIIDHTSNTRYQRAPKISQYALASAIEAVTQAGFDPRKEGAERTGIVFGTCNGPSVATEGIGRSMITKGLNKVDPLLFQESVFNAPASLMSIHFGVKGPCLTVPVGCVSGAMALDAAARLIRAGRVDRALVVASEELCQATLDAFGHLRVRSPFNGGRSSDEGMRPFDADRNGLVMAEGAFAVCLEGASSVRRRGAAALAEVAGVGACSDAYRLADNHPDGRGVALAMRRCGENAGGAPDGVGALFAGAMSLAATDAMEVAGIMTATGGRRKDVRVCSVKGVIGETMGAGSLAHVAAAVCALRERRLPPLAGLQKADPSFDLAFNQKESAFAGDVMVNAYTWGGVYASTLLRSVS